MQYARTSHVMCWLISYVGRFGSDGSERATAAGNVSGRGVVGRSAGPRVASDHVCYCWRAYPRWLTYCRTHCCNYTCLFDFGRYALKSVTDVV